MRNATLPLQTVTSISYPAYNLSSPHASVMEHITRDWINDYDCLTPEFKRQAKIANYGILTAAIIPRADVETLVPIARWMLWAFLYDDYYGPYPKGELKIVCRKALGVLRGKNIQEGDNALFRQLEVVRNDLKAISTASWMNRFVKSHEYYFQGLLLDTFSYRLNPQYPTVNQYFKIRDRLIGGFMVMDLLELADSIFPEELVNDPRIQRLRLLASRLMIYDNDIFSYKKELREGESMNLVLALQAEHNLPIEMAVDLAICMRKKEYDELIDYEYRFQEFGKYARLVKNYYQNTMILLEGQLVWYKLKSKRYE